jgi:hypothetical protein
MSYMETMTHRRRAEIAAKKWSPFRPHRGLAAPDLFLDTANRRTWEAFLIDCKKTLGNIYGNKSQACHPKGKTYRDAQLGELTHSVAVEQPSEHELICGSEPAWERGEGEAVAEQQPPQASGCEAAPSSWGR